MKTLQPTLMYFRRVQELCESQSRWPSWAPRPKEPYGFCGRKATLNHAHALLTRVQFVPNNVNPTSEELSSTSSSTDVPRYLCLT